MAVDFENLSDNARFLLESELGKAPDQRNPKYAKVTEEYSDFKSQKATEREQARPLLSRAKIKLLTKCRSFRPRYCITPQYPKNCIKSL